MTPFHLTHPRARPIAIAGLACSLTVIATCYTLGPPANALGSSTMLLLTGLAMASAAHTIHAFRSRPYPLAFQDAEGPRMGQFCVYLLTRFDGLTKIGFSGSFPSRRTSIRAAAGMEVYPLGFALVGSKEEARELEGELHTLFSEVRQHGEWFDLRVADLVRAFRRYERLRLPG